MFKGHQIGSFCYVIYFYGGMDSQLFKIYRIRNMHLIGRHKMHIIVAVNRKQTKIVFWIWLSLDKSSTNVSSTHMWMESSRTGLHQENCNMHKIVVVMLHFVFCDLMHLNLSHSHLWEFICGFGYQMLWNIYLKKMGLIKCWKVHKYVVRDAASWIIL